MAIYFFSKRNLFLLLPIALLCGCTASNNQNGLIIPSELDNGARQNIIDETKPYRFGLTPIIGSRNDDARTAVDMGVVLKIFIAPYKSAQGTMVGGHDIYAWAKEPSFLVQTIEPPTAPVQRGMMNSVGKIPFTIRPEEIDSSAEPTDQNIKKTVNEMYSRGENQSKQQQERINALDKEIKEYLREQKQ